MKRVSAEEAAAKFSAKQQKREEKFAARLKKSTEKAAAKQKKKAERLHIKQAKADCKSAQKGRKRHGREQIGGAGSFKKRTVACGVCLTLVFALTAGRIAQIALLDQYETSSAAISSYTVSVDKPRGSIFDRNLNRLTNRNPIYKAVLTATPQVIREVHRCFPTARAEEIISELGKNTPVTVTVPEDFSAKGAALFKIYDKNPSYIPSVQLLGYLDSERLHGKSGLSLEYDRYLFFDKTTSANVAASASGGMLLGVDPERNDCGDVYDCGIITTLDYDIQRAAEAALAQAKKGAIAVTQTGSGEILALASSPSFNPNELYTALVSPDSPFLNRALCGYNLGSVFKICVAAAALEEGISPEFSYCCTGSIDCGNTFYCHKADGHGEIGMSEAFAKSCNTYFINLAKEIGAEKIYQTAVNFGLSGEQSIAEGISQKGTLGQLSEIEKSPSALANFAIGQGDIMVTPLKACCLVNTAVNGGVYFPPFLVSGFKGQKEDIDYQKGTEGTRVISPETAGTLCSMMARTFEDGTAAGSRPERGVFGGKTATAETGWLNASGSFAKTAWFAGYFELGEQRLSVAVTVEDGSSGTADAVPIFKAFCDALGSR